MERTIEGTDGLCKKIILRGVYRRSVYSLKGEKDSFIAGIIDSFFIGSRRIIHYTVTILGCNCNLSVNADQIMDDRYIVNVPRDELTKNKKAQ